MASSEEQGKWTPRAIFRFRTRQKAVEQGRYIRKPRRGREPCRHIPSTRSQSSYSTPFTYKGKDKRKTNVGTNDTELLAMEADDNREMELFDVPVMSQ